MEATATPEGTIECTLTLDEALAFARFLGRLGGEALRGFNLKGGEYDRLADALEYGEHAPFPYDVSRPLDDERSLYGRLQTLPMVSST